MYDVLFQVINTRLGSDGIVSTDLACEKLRLESNILETPAV